MKSEKEWTSYSYRYIEERGLDLTKSLNLSVKTNKMRESVMNSFSNVPNCYNFGDIDYSPLVEYCLKFHAAYFYRLIKNKS